MRLSRWGKSSYETGASVAAQKQALADCVEVVDDNVDAEIIIVHSKLKVGPGEVFKMASARLVVTTTSGHEHMDLPCLHAAGIRTLRMPLLRRDAVVETTLGLILSGTRRLATFRTAAAEDRWVRGDLPAINPLTLRGLAVGVVGCGAIGLKMIEVLTTLGARVVAVDPRGGPDGVESASNVHELAGRVRVLTLHCDLNPSSRNLISRSVLERLPTGAILVNTARGGLVDETAAISALETGRLAYLGLDVFKREPCIYLRAVSDLPGLALLPHAAGFHQNLLSDMTAQLVDICRAFTSGEALPHELISRAP